MDDVPGPPRVSTKISSNIYNVPSSERRPQNRKVGRISGTVVERNLNPGQEVRPDQSGPGVPALFVVTDPTSLWVQIDARESEIGTLKIGSTFELVIPSLGGQKFEGRVTAAADYIDPATRTIKVRGVVANPNRLLKAEMLATARIERMLGSGVVVPSQAVSLIGSKHTVMVQTQPGVFESRDVTLGYQGPRETVVSSGLEAGEQVVSENMLLLARTFRATQMEANQGGKPEKDEKSGSKEPVPQSNRAQAATNTIASPAAAMASSQAKP